MGFFEKIGRKLDPEHYAFHDKQEKKREEMRLIGDKIGLARAQGKFEEAEELRKELYAKSKERGNKKTQCKVIKSPNTTTHTKSPNIKSLNKSNKLNRRKKK